MLLKENIWECLHGWEGGKGFWKKVHGNIHKEKFDTLAFIINNFCSSIYIKKITSQGRLQKKILKSICMENRENIQWMPINQ